MDVGKKVDIQELLNKAEQWFYDTIVANHIKNTEKHVRAKKLDINPLTITYLSNFLTGNSHPESIAKAYLLPKVLGTSISTSFGQNIQKFISEVLDAYGSTTSGIDIEFTDSVDGIKKLAQLKLGPQCINKDDVETITGHFKKIKNLARTNNNKLRNENLCVGVLYGESNQLSANYKAIINHDYNVYIGSDFWHRLTGESSFYHLLIKRFGSTSLNINFSSKLNEIIVKLSEHPEIKKYSNHE